MQTLFKYIITLILKQFILFRGYSDILVCALGARNSKEVFFCVHSGQLIQKKIHFSVHSGLGIQMKFSF